MEDDFEYDVAFSFTYEDEIIAKELNDHIQSSFKTFIYLNKQNELAARDGEQKFNDVFHTKSRLVVILYREKWGNTPFTRIEMNAIKNRAFDEGYDFTIMIPLNDSKPPKWYPKNRLYLNLDKYGVKTLAGVIESKIHEHGGVSQPETTVDFAKRLKRSKAIDDQIISYVRSKEAVKEGIEEFYSLIDSLQESWKEVSDLNIGYEIGQPKINKGNEGGQFEVGANGLSLQLNYSTYFNNSLDKSSLKSMIYEPAAIWNDGPKILEKVEYQFGMDRILRKGWKNKDEFLLTKQFVELWLKKILKRAKERN